MYSGVNSPRITGALRVSPPEEPRDTAHCSREQHPNRLSVLTCRTSDGGITPQARCMVQQRLCHHANLLSVAGRDHNRTVRPMKSHDPTGI